MQYLDVSVPIGKHMVVYQGDPAVSLERAASMAQGAICNVSRLDFGVHSGTHIDAPVHFIEGAAGIEATPLEALIGTTFVVDATAATSDIDENMVRQLDIPKDTQRLLFKTSNSRLWDRDVFSADFLGLTEGAALELIERGVKLVGVDYLSVAPKSDPAPTHRAFLSKGIVILEGLDLRRVDPGTYQLLCLPLLIEGSDGAPARTLLVKDA